MKHPWYKKLLSGFLSFLFVFYAGVFSFTAFVQTVHADIVDELFFPLEKITKPASDGSGGTTLNNPLCKVGEIFTDNACRKQEFADITGTKEGCEEANGHWNEETQKCEDLPWAEQENIIGMGNNRDMVAGIAGGVASFAANYFAPQTMAVVNNFVANQADAALNVVTQGSTFSSAMEATNSLQTSISNYNGTLSDASTIGADGITGSSVGSFKIDFAGAAAAGAVAGIVTLLMGGSIEQAAIAAVKSTVTSIAANAIATMLISNLGAGGLLLGMGPVGWAIAIGVILSLLMQMFCPIIMIELPDGTISYPSSFLVGKINKNMKGDSWEKLLLSEEEIGSLNQNCKTDSGVSRTPESDSDFLTPRQDPRGETKSTGKCIPNEQKFPSKLNTAKSEILPDTSVVDTEKFAPLGVVIGEVLPEILYLDSLKIWDLQYDSDEEGKWFMDQNGEAQYFSVANSIQWQKNKEALAPVLFGNALDFEIPNEGDSVIPAETGIQDKHSIPYAGEESGVEVDPRIKSEDDKKNEEYSLREPQADNLFLTFSQPNTDTLEFTVQNPKNADLKLLFEGGIQTAYHAKKLNMLAKFRPVLAWFYALSDNTFIGKIVEREILAKEGFTLQEKMNGEWKTLHQWVTYEDQRRAVTIKNDKLKIKNEADRNIATYRVVYDSDYLKLHDVYASIEKNPEYSIKELQSETLLPNLKETDGIVEQIETGTYYKFTFGVPYIDSGKNRELFMQSNGYYHPLTDKEYLEEMRKNYHVIEDFIMKWLP